MRISSLHLSAYPDMALPANTMEKLGKLVVLAGKMAPGKRVSFQLLSRALMTN
jgi:hypothetical protein